MELGVAQMDVASDRRTYDVAHEAAANPGERYTPADFAWQFASVIAICLGFALMAHVLVALIGAF
jgi:hypothetical protein